MEQFIKDQVERGLRNISSDVSLRVAQVRNNVHNWVSTNIARQAGALA